MRLFFPISILVLCPQPMLWMVAADLMLPIALAQLVIAVPIVAVDAAADCGVRKHRLTQLIPTAVAKYPQHQRSALSADDSQHRRSVAFPASMAHFLVGPPPRLVHAAEVLPAFFSPHSDTSHRPP